MNKIPKYKILKGEGTLYENRVNLFIFLIPHMSLQVIKGGILNPYFIELLLRKNYEKNF